MRSMRGLSWWRALRGRWGAVRRVPDGDDRGDMGTAFGLEACLQADLEFRAAQEARQQGADAPAPFADRLNGRSVI